MIQDLTSYDKGVNQKHHTFFKLLVFLVSAFLLLTVVVHLNPVLSLDLEITKAIQSYHPGWFDFLMRFLTELGYVPEEVVLPLLTAAFLFFINWKKESLVLMVSSVGIVLVSETIKRVVARPRPDGSLIIQVGEFVKHDSFPSGHVLFFIGFFGFLLYLIFTRLKKGWLRTLFCCLFLSLIILIGVSRIYLGAHWFSDVLGSYLIGSAWLLLIVQLQSSNLKRWFPR